MRKSKRIYGESGERREKVREGAKKTERDRKRERTIWREGGRINRK